MRRPTGYAAMTLGVSSSVAAGAVLAVLTAEQFETPVAGVVPLGTLLVKLLSALAVVALTYGVYTLVVALLARSRAGECRRLHDLRNLLGLSFGGAAAIALLGIVTEKRVGVLFSLGWSASRSPSPSSSRCPR